MGDSENTDYYGSQYMFVLNTYNKSWEIPTRITNYKNRKLFVEGSTIQLSANNTIAYIFGGITHSTGSYSLSSRIRVLNINNFTWLETADRDDDYRVLPRSYASSAIIRDKYLVVAFGSHFLKKSSESKDVDIFILPSTIPNSSVLTPENKNEVIIRLFNPTQDPVISVKRSNIVNSWTIFFIIFIVSTALAVGFIIALVANRKRIKNGNIYLLQVISKDIWNRRLVYNLFIG